MGQTIYQKALDYLEANESLLENGPADVVFKNLGFKNDPLKSEDLETPEFELGKTIVEICYNPEININLLKDVTRIPSYFFYGSKFETIDIPNSVKEIDMGAFCKSKIRTLNIPETVSNYAGLCVDGCDELETVEFNQSQRVLGSFAVSECPKLRKIKLPDNLMPGYSFSGTTYWIRENAIGSCTSLESMNIPEYVDSIDDGAFYDCPKLVLDIASKNEYAINYAKINNIKYNLV